MKKYMGEEFLSKLYRDMHTDEQVEKSSEPSDSKYEKIRKYLSRLEEVHRKLSEKEKLSVIKHYYYKKYVIKSKNITDEYFNHLEEIALNRGYGHITYDEYSKSLEKRIIINDQKKSLDVWIDYFCSEDSNMYPMWFKYYTFQSIVKLGSFNKEKNVFNQRTKETISPFPDLNREALALMYDCFVAQMNGEQEFDDEELQKLIKGGSFKKIYANLIKKLSLISKEQTNVNDGVWIKYERGTDHMPLVKSLEGKGTGWCTAGESTAQSQLAMGDFHVYYTYDLEGKPTIPRLAIRMEENRIAEIRGIAKAQHIETEMEKVLEEKLEEFPDKDEYLKKVNDMKIMSLIYKKFQNKKELELQDLRFLYEIDEQIQGFGYNKDPRIEEILEKREKRKDLSRIFKCSEEQIAMSIEELNKNTIYLEDDLDLSIIKRIKSLNLPKVIKGDLDLSRIKSLECVKLPEIIGGALKLSGLKNAKNLNLPRVVKGDLDLSGVTSAESIVFPEIIGGTLDLSNLKSAKDLVLPKTIKGNLKLNNLINIGGVVLPETIEGDLNLSRLKFVKNIIFPNKVNGDLNLQDLIIAENIVFPKVLKGKLDLCQLTRAKNVLFPPKYEWRLNLKNLRIAEDLILPKIINGSIDLSGLTTAKGLVLPEKIDGFLNLDGLNSAKDVVLPQIITWGLFLNGLKSAKDLIIPKTINCMLGLNGLETAEGLVLPEIMNGDLNLIGLKEAKDLILPKQIKGDLVLSNLLNLDGVVLPEIIDGDLIKIEAKSIDSSTSVAPKTIKKIS